MNHFNPAIILGWLANIDISPCTSLQAVITYAAKYCSKSEKKTEPYCKLADQVLPHTAHHQPLLSFSSRLMNKLIAERDYSAQEICHLLLNIPLQEGTRMIAYVDCRPLEQHGRSYRVDEDVSEAVGSYQKYLQRSETHEGITYLDYLQSYNLKTWRRLRVNAKQRVLSYFPRYQPVAASPQFHDFCRVKLMMSHPHRSPDELLAVDGQRFESFAAAYQCCQQRHHSHLSGVLRRRLLREIRFRALPCILCCASRLTRTSSRCRRSTRQLQKKLKNIRYLIIDEKSMLGLRQLSWIDDRLREAFPGMNDVFFGGLNILLVGDFFQLPPVLQKPLYYDKEVQGVEIKGRNAYRRFDKTVFLKVAQRQRGEDQEAFRTALGELRQHQLSTKSWKLLSGRVQAKLADQEVAGFAHALRVYSTKDMVNEYNHYHLDRLGRPVIQITARNVGAGAAAAPDDKAGNLAKHVPVCIGARLMLTCNLWQQVGLCNGARGTVYDMAWAPGANPIRDQPCAIMIEFDKYTGPALLTTTDGRKIVPILPLDRDFLIGTDTVHSHAISLNRVLRHYSAQVAEHHRRHDCDGSVLPRLSNRFELRSRVSCENAAGPDAGCAI
ncbi:DNA repair and recombination protein PIF1 [Beauveria bassiana D1-5]|uniref:ATP-dependent DNA helicase n=1 Tax=Beauveria bassiana D1-5 TaxID=1245745 RepID=A0A0A2V5J6_BEABA|nr:DNA repair and recombination protein PIF1 [Beauveria bassiana D1-5]